jgi:hypothetical protein
MRISGLLVILLCGLVSVGGASDAVRQSSSAKATASSFNPDGSSTPGIVRPDFSGPAGSDRADRDHRRFDPAGDGDVTCYTIESYLVKRESPHSDVTEPAGHSTCLPASKYGVRKVEEPGGTPPR